MNTIEIQNKIATNRDLIDRIVRSEMPILQIKEQIRNLAKQNEKLLIKFNEQMEKQKTSEKANEIITDVSNSEVEVCSHKNTYRDSHNTKRCVKCKRPMQ
jgi:uncharacterized protein with PIN domain